MQDNTLVESSVSAIINAPIEVVNIPDWCFTMPESEYQACSPAHCSAGTTIASDGRRMSINVEMLGGNGMVQHWVEDTARRDHVRLLSNSDVFTPTGRVKVGVMWDLSVRKIGDKTCGFSNLVHTFATPELLDHLGKQGVPFKVFQTGSKPVTDVHTQQETPEFAKSIERHAHRSS